MRRLFSNTLLTLSTLCALITVYLWIRQGLCEVCGYDLRATPHQCPECGTIYADRPAPTN